MNFFEECIDVYNEWRKRLKKYLANPDGSIDPDVVGRDDLCLLGRWLNKEGKYILYPPEIRELNEEHIKFHKILSEIIRNSELWEETLRQLEEEESNSEFQNEFQSEFQSEFQESFSRILFLLKKLSSTFKKKINFE